MRTFFALAAAVALLAGCAAYDGRGLVPGSSSARDVEKLMGVPSEKDALPGGGELWFYPRAPQGRDTYAVRISPSGELVSIEQRLTKENLAKVVEGKSTKPQVHDLLGPPLEISRTRTGFEEWDYRVMVDNRWFDFLVDFSDDGIARHAWLLHDPIYDSPDGKD